MKKKHIDVWECIIVFVMMLFAGSCVLPVLNLFAESLSLNEYVMAGKITIYPIGFNLDSYAYVMKNSKFWNAMFITLNREGLGVVLGLLMTLLTAYPLSKSPRKFKGRTAYVWFFFFTTLFSGGTIAWYFNIKMLGLLNSIWALVLPGLVNVFNILLLLNFFRGVPGEIEEAALIDGADHFITLFRIYLPMSMPCLATITLYIVVEHWNSWFDGTMLMQSSDMYPLSSYLRTLLFQQNNRADAVANWEQYKKINDRTIKAAQMFVAMVPIMMVYPFLQRYFVKGIMLGGVKG